MFFIVNYSKFWRYPETFLSFNGAKRKLDEIHPDSRNIIEHFNMKNFTRKVVYTSRG